MIVVIAAIIAVILTVIITVVIISDAEVELAILIIVVIKLLRWSIQSS